jgi:phosphatidylethanolamine-binding protein (PEBP) family uncharacterized protein
MGRRFGSGQDGFFGGVSRAASLTGVAVCLCAAGAIVGCGEGSGAGSASVPSTGTTAATTATTTSTPTTQTTPSTASTSAKPPASKSSKSSTPTTKSSTTPSKPPVAKSSSEPSKKPATQEKTFGRIKVTSTAFKVGGPIAVKYTCDGAGISPPLQWQGVPQGAAEVFVLAVDLSGGSREVVQWAIAGIPPNATSIPEGSLPPGAIAGVNSAGKIGWGGMCGAKGQLQHVGFLFYALKRKLALKPGFNPIEVRGGLKGVTLATGLTLATYKRH